MPVPLLAILGAGMGIFGFMVGTVNPLARSITYGLNMLWPNAIPEIDIILRMYLRKLISEDDLKRLAKQHGYTEGWTELFVKLMEEYPTIAQLIDMIFRGQLDEDQASSYAERLGFTRETFTKMIEISRPLLSASTLITLYFRGEIGEEEFREKMKAHGWKDEDVEKIVKASLVYPSPSDVVRFAVREVYTPEIVEKYGLLEDLPPEYLEMAKKVGMSEEFAKQYWAAHLSILPS